MVAIRRREQKNSFENYDVDLAEIVAMLAESRRGLLREIRFHVDAAGVSQRQYHSLEHLIESNCAFVEVLCWVSPLKADVWEIQPAINADYCRLDTALHQRLSDARGDEALSSRIDPADSNEQGPLRRKRCPLLDDCRNHRSIFEHNL
jgi:hypothetical protein